MFASNENSVVWDILLRHRIQLGSLVPVGRSPCERFEAITRDPDFRREICVE